MVDNLKQWVRIEARDLTVIAAENGDRAASSNNRRGYLCFAFALMPLGRVGV